MKRMKTFLAIATLALSVALGGQAMASSIYVINDTSYYHGMVQNAVSNLNTLGYSVSTGGTLANYSPYSQVWDLRYSSNLGASDISSMSNYLQSGGRLYLTGEHSGFDSIRNLSLVNFISGVGGGNLNLLGEAGWQGETFTAEGNSLLNNNPNSFSSIQFNAARTVSSAGAGFLATEEAPGSGRGSLVGWNFGDIAGAEDARMLVGFDIEIFGNGLAWTENMATYLGDSAPVPEPGTVMLLGAGFLGLAFYGKRRKNA